MSISLVAGLGNPGVDYASTRHNLGWIVLDAFAQKLGLVWKKQTQFNADVARWDRPGVSSCYLVKPLTFMNDSGISVGAVSRFYKIESTSILTVYDDLNIDLGLVKVSVTGSAGGHNGVASLIERLEPGFVRYRLGIGPKIPTQMDLKDFVLGKFTPDQHILVTQLLPHYLSGLELLLTRGTEAAMNQLNRRDPK
jgi:PTH1 family peptidyl-tRNA hydrolase